SAGADVRLRRPVVYQQIGGERREIAGEYVLGAGYEVGFRVAAYDRTQALVIDPTFVFGGTNDDQLTSMAVGADGAVYLAGVTASTDFPVMGGVQASAGGGGDAFITKLMVTNASATMVYSTYLGGNASETFAAVAVVAVDAAGNVYVTGSTDSLTFPTTTTAFQKTCNCAGTNNSDVIVSKLNPTASMLLYSTLLGGGANDFANALAIDSGGRVY